MSVKKAQLIATSVAVLCPNCGAEQPSRDGSDIWIEEDFKALSGKRICVGCETTLIIGAEPKVQFEK